MEAGGNFHSFSPNFETQARRLPSRGSFDLRRPIMSNSTARNSYSFSDYIDLTGPDDPPDSNITGTSTSAYAVDPAEIIDLEDPASFHGGRASSDQVRQDTNDRSAVGHSSDEIQYLYSRQLANGGRNSSRQQNLPTHPRFPQSIPPGSILPVPWGSMSTYADTHPQPHHSHSHHLHLHHQTPSVPDANAVNLWGSTSSFTGFPARVYRHLTRQIPNLSSMSTRPPQHRLDYSQAAFNVFGHPSLEDEHARSRASSVPAVEDLPPVPTGFTRTPEEGMSLICPNCERELTVGQTDSQRHIFVAKSCGHVYCGECARNRAQTKRKREKMPSTEFKTKPFSTCVAPGCKTSLRSPNAMVQIFL